MSMEKTEGIVIRQTDWSESSRIVTFFTREFGKISAIAKGARRLKGPFDAAIDLLTQCRIVFIRKSTNSLDILTEAQLISRFSPNQRDITSLYGGYYVAELLAGFTEDYDPHPELYDETVWALDRLQHDDQTQHAILRYELVVLREIGQLPAFDECVICGEPVQENGIYAFWVSQSGIICPNCRKKQYSSHQLQPGTISLLQKLSSESREFAQGLVVSPQQVREIRSVTTSAISYALGRKPAMLRYLST